LNHFFSDIAGLSKDWSAKLMLKEATELVEGIGDSKVLCAFSGGVDSLVAATLAHQIVGENM
ncbi:MAG: GMP synthase (glutamine-hydrolyzing), partial [Alcanivorax sp.]|nr:GMP synthase (glutamine-hydrolyzing) [Alcanivorax sp.]